MAFSGQSVEGPVYYNNCGAFGKFQHQNDTKFECSCPTWVPTQVNGLWENASGRYVRKCGQASICKSGNGFVKVENVPLVATMTTTMSANERSISSFTASIFILNTQHCCWIPSPLLGILTALISQIWISII